MQSMEWKLFVAYLATNISTASWFVAATYMTPEQLVLAEEAKQVMFWTHVMTSVLHHYRILPRLRSWYRSMVELIKRNVRR